MREDIEDTAEQYPGDRHFEVVKAAITGILAGSVALRPEVLAERAIIYANAVMKALEQHADAVPGVEEDVPVL